MATQPANNAGASGSGISLRGIALNLLVDAALPFVAYQILTAHGTDTIHALIIGGIFPAAWGMLGIVRARRVDIIAGLVLVGIAVSIVAALIGGNAKLLLIRESLVTGALGLVALGSLLAPRPLMFYFGRQMATGMDPARMAAFDAAWRFPWFQRLFLFLTIVWGIGWVGEFALRVVLVSILTVPQALAITPVLFNLITVALILWTFAYSRHVRASHAGELRRSPPAGPVAHSIAPTEGRMEDRGTRPGVAGTRTASGAGARLPRRGIAARRQAARRAAR